MPNSTNFYERIFLHVIPIRIIVSCPNTEKAAEHLPWTLLLCAKKNCNVIVLNHLTNKFQPLHISVDKAAKSFISGKYNIQIANEVSN